ncbi:hypothetical protein MKW92_030182, partial [Papaver armeniacum]
MEDLFDDLVGFLMTEEEEVVQTNTAEETLASEGNDDQITMPTGMISSFSNGTDDCQDQPEEADWYTQYSDLQYPDHLGEERMMYNTNHPSNDIQPDNLYTDVNGFFQENDGLIDQYINDETTWLLQQQAADDGHQAQSSTSLLPAVVPHIDDDNIVIHVDNNVELLINNLPDSSTSEQQLSRVQEIQERPADLLKVVGEPVVKQTKRRKKGKQVVLVNHVEEEEEDNALGAAEAEDFLKDLVIDNEEDDDEDNIGDDNQSSSVLSKNLISERMRRKRLNKRLLTLRGMVPNITKMDKRSVLVDALAYLQDILHQTKIEMENQNNISGTADAATEDPRGYIVGSPTSPIDVETDHLPCCHHLGVVSEKGLVNASAEDQPQPIMMSTVHKPSISPNTALFPAITMMEADKIDEERYLLKIVYNKALGAMAHIQRS